METEYVKYSTGQQSMDNDWSLDKDCSLDVD